MKHILFTLALASIAGIANAQTQWALLYGRRFDKRFYPERTDTLYQPL